MVGSAVILSLNRCKGSVGDVEVWIGLLTELLDSSISQGDILVSRFLLKGSLYSMYDEK